MSQWKYLYCKKLRNIFDGSYMNHNKLLLQFFGLWPYSTKFYKRLAYLIYAISGLLLMIPMMLGLKDETSTNTVIKFETLVTVLVIFGGFAQCTMMYIRQHVMKVLYDKIEMDLEMTTDSRELAILYSFSRSGRSLIIAFVASTLSCYMSFIILTYWPVIVGESEASDYSEVYPYYSKHWIIDERLRNPQVILHFTLFILYSCSFYIAVVSTFIGNVQHICGMYTIVLYRLKRLVDANKAELKSFEKLEDDSIIVPRLLAIVNKHREAVRGVHLVIKLFSRTFFVVEVCLLLSLGFFLFDVKYNTSNIRLMFRICSTAMVLTIYAFYMNYGGEMIIEYSNAIHSATYFIRWYMISVKARKMLLMLVQRTSRPDQLSASIITLSLANFASIVKGSWSMATVLLTAQRKSRTAFL